MKFFFWIIFGLPFYLESFVIGNPAEPLLMSEGVLSSKDKAFSIRIGFLDDYVYSQHMKGEYFFDEEVEKPPLMQFSTEAGIVTFNVYKRFDIYAILGSSRMQIDQEIFARRQFAWSIGGKGVLLDLNSLRLGLDLKYFETTQNPMYLVFSGMPLDIVSNLKLLYREYQAALALSYKSGIFCPYIAGTYLNSKMEPNIPEFLVRVPGMEDLGDAEIESFIGASTWGMAVGATLVMGANGTLSIESRFFNQNAIDASLEIRF